MAALKKPPPRRSYAIAIGVLKTLNLYWNPCGVHRLCHSVSQRVVSLPSSSVSWMSRSSFSWYHVPELPSRGAAV
jgi:hypothetical protein